MVNGTSTGWEEQYQTHVMERKRNAGVGDAMSNTFEARLGPVMSVNE